VQVRLALDSDDDRSSLRPKIPLHDVKSKSDWTSVSRQTATEVSGHTTRLPSNITSLSHQSQRKKFPACTSTSSASPAAAPADKTHRCFPRRLSIHDGDALPIIIQDGWFGRSSAQCAHSKHSLNDVQITTLNAATSKVIVETRPACASTSSERPAPWAK